VNPMATWRDFASPLPGSRRTARQVLSEDHVFVLITPDSPKRHDLGPDGRFTLQTFSRPRAGSDEFDLAGGTHLADDAATRERLLRDARHRANASESLFELTIDRAMHTRWENGPTPEMRSRHRTWRSARSADAG
jgi:hypothetical protein